MIVPFLILVPLSILLSNMLFKLPWDTIALVVLFEGILSYALFRDYKETINNYGRLRISLTDDGICLNFPSVEMYYPFAGIKKIILGQREDKPLFMQIHPKQGGMQYIRGIDNFKDFAELLQAKVPVSLLKIERNHIG